MDKKKLDDFMKEIKDVFEKYNKKISLKMLIHSADLYIDTLKKEYKKIQK